MCKVREYISESIEETKAIASDLAKIFKPNDVVLLNGELGSGKTFLVKEICRRWQTRDEPSSPSFAIIQQYRGPVPVYHLDFYRIEDVRELDELGWEELISGEAVTFIEWPKFIEAFLDHYYRIDIRLEENRRIFTLNDFNTSHTGERN